MSAESSPILHEFDLLRSLIGPENSNPLSQPIRCKTKSNHDLAGRRHFPGPDSSLVVFSLSSLWISKVFSCPLFIGLINYFGFGCMVLNRIVLSVPSKSRILLND